MCLARICHLTVILPNLVLMKRMIMFSILLLTISCSTTKSTVTEDGKGNLKNNLKEGKWTFYSEGKRNSAGHYSKGEKCGRWKYFYPNGKLHQKGRFLGDKQDGIWNYYFDSGEFMGAGKMVNGKQDGLWKWFYKNGNLYTERLYANGKLVEIRTCLDKDKKALDCGKINNGNGILIYHDLENETDTIQKFTFENGVIKR